MSNVDPDTNQLHSHVGKVIRQFALLENSLWTLVQSLLGVDQIRARIIVASFPNTRARTTLIQRLGETYIDASLLPKFRGLMKRVGKLSGRRNILAHSLLGPNGPNKWMIVGDSFSDEMDGGWDFKPEQISEKEILELATACGTLHMDLVKFLFDLNGKVHTSTRMHREEQKSQTP